MRAVCLAIVAAGLVLRVAFPGRLLGTLGTVLGFVALLVLVASARGRKGEGGAEGETPTRRWRPVRALIPILVVIVVAFVAQRIIGNHDERQITRAIERVATSGDPGYCDDAVTASYLEQATAEVEPFARLVCRQEARRMPADSVHVSEISVDGDVATARVEKSGSLDDGSVVLLGLAKQNGEWRLDHRALYIRFDRPRFERAYREFFESDSTAAAADCAAARVREISDERLEQALLSDTELVFAKIGVECHRARVERAVIDAVADEGSELSPRVVECAERTVAAAGDAELAAIWAETEEFEEMLNRCDPRWLPDSVRHSLVSNGETDAAAAECVAQELEGLQLDQANRLVYEEDRYRDLIERCEEANSGSVD